MALHLCRPKYRFPNNPCLIHLFSTSSSNNDDDNKNDSNNSNNISSSLNSYFSDAKASLEKKSTQTTPSSSFEGIRKNLAEYRQGSAVPPLTTEPNPAASQSPHRISFQELYQRNQSLSENQINEKKPAAGKLSFEAISERLRQEKPNMNRNPINNYRSNEYAGNYYGEMMERERMETEFAKMYSFVEQGVMPGQLHPPEGTKESGGVELEAEEAKGDGGEGH